MKLCAPKYYQSFACTADKCTHSCCIGWEIDIDSNTAQKYELIDDGYGKEIKLSIDADPTPHFMLGEGERCPHLDERGLCRIILECGEEYLCDICREHPRFYNRSPLGMEVGIGMCCEEAAGLILSSDEYGELVEIAETDEPADDSAYDSVTPRERVFSILAYTADHDRKLDMIYREFDVSPSICADEEWRKLIDSLEYMNAEHKEMFMHYSSGAAVPKDAEKLLERTLAYFVYRHCTEVYDFGEFREHLGFSLFCERLFASLMSVYGTDGAVRLARIISEEIEYSEDNTETITERF